MRIIHFDYDYKENPFAGGGQANATHELYKRISRKHDVIVFTGSYPSSKNEVIEGVSYKRIGIGNFGAVISILSYWVLFPVYSIFLKADLFTEFFTAPFAVSFLPLVKRKTVGYASFVGSKDLSKKYKLPFHFLIPMLIGRYHTVIFLSERYCSQFKNRYKNLNATVLPRGVDSKFLSAPALDNAYMLFLGRIDIHQKGIDTLLEAMYKVIYINKISTRLYIGGNGKPEDMRTLRYLIEKYKLNSYVKVLGRVASGNRVELLTNAQLVLCPSRFETFGNVALESLASGKPLICTNIDGYSWIPAECACKIATLTPSILADSIIHLLQDAHLRGILSTNARKFAKDFSWDVIAAKYESILLEASK